MWMLTILFKILTKKCVLCRSVIIHTHTYYRPFSAQHLIYSLSWLVCRLTIKTIALSVLVLRGVSVDMVPNYLLVIYYSDSPESIELDTNIGFFFASVPKVMVGLLLFQWWISFKKSNLYFPQYFVHIALNLRKIASYYGISSCRRSKIFYSIWKISLIRQITKTFF